MPQINLVNNIMMPQEFAGYFKPGISHEKALELLANWNGEMNEHLPEPLIYAAWLRQLQHKLVAVDDRVYVTLGFHAPLSALDAVLAGRPPSPDQTPSIGCNIKWRAGNAPNYFTGQPTA